MTVSHAHNLSPAHYRRYFQDTLRVSLLKGLLHTGSWKGLAKMFRIDKKKSVTGEVLQDERTAYDSILKAADQKTRGKISG